MENKTKPEIKRLYSLDALRGFDMFWIMGGEGLIIALAALTGWPFFQWWNEHLDHAVWDGFHFMDLIFPLFLFIAGISFPFSKAKRYHGPKNRKALYIHIIKRGLILVLLGIIYNNAVRFNFSTLRYGSVLGHIGLAWMFASLIFINTKLTFRIVWFCGILLGYWALLLLFPATDLGATDPFSMQGSLVGYIDRLIMPGKLYLDVHDPEGILNILPAIATALLGMFTGEYIMSSYLKNSQLKKVLYMIVTGIGFILIGLLWNMVFPINKNLWSSSFVCFVGGISIILFSIFYLVIDVWNIKKWSFFFVVIGMNSITIYLADNIINFGHASKFLFGGLKIFFPATYAPLIASIGLVLTGWLFLYFLYRKKIFLKV
jgi:predicted acyltransferase